MANHSKVTEEMYITIDNPDNRKRFTVIFEKNENEIERNVIMIPTNLSFSGFLGSIINKFKLESSQRPFIRVKTRDGKRIKNLTHTYNNQIIYFTISEIADEDPEDQEQQQQQQILTKSQEYEKEIQEKLANIKSPEKEYLLLYNDATENKNQFYQSIIVVLLAKYQKNKVVVGESYPYRLKVLISDQDRNARVWLYFIQTLTPDPTSSLEYTFNVIVQTNKIDQVGVVGKRDAMLALISSLYDQDKTDILKIVSTIEKYYTANFFTSPVSFIPKGTIDLFVDKVKLNTESQNKLLDKIYGDIDKVSEYFDITRSLSRKLLFHNNWIAKNVIGQHQHKEQNRQIINSFGYPHKAKDISLFKFNSFGVTSNEDFKEENEECSICYCEYSKSEMIELVCGHKFCNSCMKHYFKSSIDDGNGGNISIVCPSIGCANKCVDETTIESVMLDEPKRVIDSLELLVQDYLYTSLNNHMCPEKDCGRLILGLKNTNKYIPYVTCGNHSLCLFCKKSGLHWPMSCQAPEYKDGDIYSYKWIIQNTTVCSRCKHAVFKDQGCNHITCTRCRHQFCYMCGGDYLTHGTCSGNKEKKYKLFFNTLNNGMNVDVGFLQEFFQKGSFETSDQIVKHIYQSFVSLITEQQFVNKKHLQLLQSAVFFLHSHTQSKYKSFEEATTLSSCQLVIKKLLRPDIIGAKAQMLMYGGKVEPPMSTLSVTLCENGIKKSLAKIFVNTQFPLFKQEIVNALNKVIPDDQVEYDVKKIRIYSLYGGQIKSSQEILNGEPIFISRSIHEQWIEPQIPTLTEKEIELARKQIELENQQDVIISFDKGDKVFTALKPKDKRKNDKLKLIEKSKQQQQLKEKLIQDVNNVGNGGDSSTIDEASLIEQYYYYRNQLSSDDECSYQDEADGEFEEYNEEDFKDDIDSTTTTTTNTTATEIPIATIVEQSLSFEGEEEFVNIDSNSSSSEFEDGDDELLQLKQLQMEQDKLLSEEEAKEKAAIEKEQKQIEIIFKILEIYQDEKIGLDFDKVFSVCSNARSLSHATKMMTVYLDETYYSQQYGISQTYVLIKEKLAFTFPKLSIKVIDTAIKQSKYDHDKAKAWIYNKYSRQQKKKFQKLSKVNTTNTVAADASTTVTNTRRINTSEQFEIDSDQEDQDVDTIEDTIHNTLHDKYKYKQY